MESHATATGKDALARCRLCRCFNAGTPQDSGHHSAQYHGNGTTATANVSYGSVWLSPHQRQREKHRARFSVRGYGKSTYPVWDQDRHVCRSCRYPHNGQFQYHDGYRNHTRAERETFHGHSTHGWLYLSTTPTESEVRLTAGDISSPCLKAGVSTSRLLMIIDEMDAHCIASGLAKGIIVYAIALLAI